MLAASTFCAALSSAQSLDTNALSGTNALRPYQFITTNTPPLSPAVFNPDAGGTRAPINAAPVRRGLFYQWRTNGVPPAAPGAFNPDPGAMLKSAPTNPPVFMGEPMPPAYQGEPVPKDLELPRPNVRSQELSATNSTPGSYSGPPIPPGLELPRANTRGDTYIKEKWENPEYPVGFDKDLYPPFSEPETNRWRIGFVPWRRYTSGDIEQPYESPKPMLWQPYGQSVLKGDSPVIGQDIFLDLTASSMSFFEARRIPTGSGVSAQNPNSAEFFGNSDQYFVQNNFAFTVDLFKGMTVFQPVEWALRLEPVFNINYTYTNERGVISPNPAKGTDRFDSYQALQQAFVEVHIHDLSEDYDFVATRIGNQVFNSDFRGFIFNDTNLGARIFGDAHNNLWQYNVIVFDMNEKDTNSELNEFNRRDQNVIIANVYRQDALWHGYTAQLSFHANLDHGRTHYDSNGFLARPAPIGTVVPHDVNAYYFGWAGDGHIGRLNLSHAAYEVIGHDSFNGLAGHPVDINAQMAALELSYDHNWIRYKASIFYASGDGKPQSGTANGFDSIVDNPNFTGGPFSWYVHQGFNLAGTSVNLKQRDSLLPDLRTSKTEGQANFVNPGILVPGVGTEIEATPKLRVFGNVNYIRFNETAPLEDALLTPSIHHDLGWDLSVGFQYRPLLTDNVIISAGLGVLLPGQGYKDIYQTSAAPVPGYGSSQAAHVDDFLYSGTIAVTLTY